MSPASPAIRDFARRLIALEAARAEPTGAHPTPAVRVCDQLRVSLARLAGVDGFRSLLSRALALAQAEVPGLAGAKVRADGTLEGLDGRPTEDDPAAADGAGVVIVAQLLELLVTFIGESLTQHLVRDAWPDVTGTVAGSGEQS